MTTAQGSRIALVAVAVLLVLAGLVAMAGANPVAAMAALWQGAFGARYMTAETIVTLVPLGLVGLGIIPALRAGVFPIGAQGQLICGAALSTAVVQASPEASAWYLIPVGAVAGLAGGVVFALLPAVLRAYRGVNEILSTLLMNYIAVFGLQWALKGPLAASVTTATPRSDPLPHAALLPNVLHGTRLHAGIFLVVLLALMLAWWVRTRSGLIHQLFAERRGLAARLGLSEPRAVVGTMLFSGAICGLAGWVQVAGLTHTLYPSVDGGIGFSGILISVLGGLSPLGAVIAAFCFAVLTTGAQGMQFGTHVPAAISVVAQGFVLLGAAVALARTGAAPVRQTPAEEEPSK